MFPRYLLHTFSILAAIALVSTGLMIAALFVPSLWKTTNLVLGMLNLVVALLCFHNIKYLKTIPRFLIAANIVAGLLNLILAYKNLIGF